MKIKEFVDQLAAIGYQVTATCFRDTVIRITVYRHGQEVAAVDDMYAHNHNFAGNWRPENVSWLGTEHAHQQMVHYVEQLSDTKIEHRGRLPEGVPVKQLDTEWLSTQCA